MKRLPIACLLLIVFGLLSMPSLRAQEKVDWCRLRCDEVFSPEYDMPKCERFKLEFKIVDGKSQETRIFIKECQEEFAEWGNKVARREQMRDEAFEADKSLCLEWCKKVSGLRKGEAFSFNNRELWQVLEDLNTCTFDALYEMELSLFPMTINCRGMAFVPAGKFLMGCNESHGTVRDREKPVHLVYLDAFFVDKHEVTVAAYRRCVEARVCSKPQSHGTLKYYNWDSENRDNHPVNGVDWFQSSTYCRWAKKRLCTEGEWEKAARGTDGRRFPWGSDEPNSRYTYIDSGMDEGEGERPWPVLSYTWPVCYRPSGNSPYGLCDMAGNVWEWVADWYDEGYYSSSPELNPKGPDKGKLRVIRGGRFYRIGFFLGSCRRSFFETEDLFPYLGFRCCKSVR